MLIWFFQTFVDLNVHSKLYYLSLTKFHGTVSLFFVVLLSAYVVQAVFLYILSSLSWRFLILGKSFCCSAHLSFSSCPANCCYTVYMDVRSLDHKGSPFQSNMNLLSKDFKSIQMRALQLPSETY